MVLEQPPGSIWKSPSTPHHSILVGIASGLPQGLPLADGAPRMECLPSGRFSSNTEIERPGSFQTANM